ncbi:DUF6788 family protein [Dictyobacter arantiisoli]|uniref:Bacterial transcriptional activator domain-containing protein n=1 Tax=Dictyobacter arantiisoli TaxID=2014874 RepID=A0A5A5TDH7_9CHLR|nr:hypothetical protein KDI_31540 [Dictyobacter arantiisoli]
MIGKVTYRQQFTRCGKQRCRKCKEGSGHGPYWYAYWSENGRTVSKYIGIQLPENAQKDQSLTLNTATLSPQDVTPVLRVYLLGQFRIERKSTSEEWQGVDGRLWHRRRARALLGCLLSSPNRRLGREQVMNLLWPDLDVDIAANRLNGAVHELRQMLEPDLTRPANSQLLRLERDVLELANANQIWVDAEAFELLIKEADTSTDPVRSRQLQEEAAALYRGSYFLEELYAEWATIRRDALHRAWVGLLLNLAQSQAHHEEYASAIETLDRLRAADSTNETALQHLMMLLTQRDRRGEALQVYRQYEAMLAREEESEPLPETTELYEKLRRGHIPALYTHTPPKSEPLKIETFKDETAQRASPTPLQDVHAQPELSFTRPIFQLGRHNQSPLIGREHEFQTLLQVMHDLEKYTHAMESAYPIAKAKDPFVSQNVQAASTSRPRHTHFVLLRGESGIGKTRLAEELSLEAYKLGWTVAWSRSYEQESSIPYHPWTDLLRTLFKSTAAFKELVNHPREDTILQELTKSSLKLDRLSAFLPDLEIINQAGTNTKSPLAISHEQERIHLWEAALGLISTFSKQRPLLLVLDDLHWADDSSIDLLTYLIHHLQDHCILLIGTCREGELAPQHKLRSLISDLQREQAITIVPVLPLTHTQIGTMVSYLPQDIVQSIQSQASGNPFFAEELARYIGSSYPEETDQTEAVEKRVPGSSLYSSTSPTSYPHSRQNDVANQTDRDYVDPTISLPEGIAAVLERRLGRLSSGCQQLLGKVAVIGGSFELRQLLPLATEYDEDTVLDLLEEALNAGLLIEEGTGANIHYHFWHPLIISHLYSRLSAARRAQLHRRIAETIKTTTINQPEKKAAMIVYHLNKGGGDAATLAYYAELAGNQAYTLAAYTEAQQYYVQVFQALTNDEQLYTSTHPDVHQDIQHIIKRDVDQLPFTAPLKLCHILELVAECGTILGDFALGRQVYEYILALRTSNRFQQHIYASLPVNAREDLRKKEAQIQSLLWREIGNTWTFTSEYEQAYLCYERGKEAMVQAGISNGAAWACLHLQYGALLRLEGDYHQARRYLQEALIMLEGIVHTPLTSSLEGNKNYAKQKQISHHQNILTPHAEQPADYPLSRIERALTGNPLEIGYAHERLGIVAASLGEVNSALEHLHTALAIYEQSELISEMARLCGNLGAVNILKGAHDAARTYMKRSLELAERSSDIPNITFVTHNLGDVAQRSGALQEAETWFTQSLSLAKRINDRERISWSNIALASVQTDMGKIPEAVNSILHALNISRAIKNQRCIRYALIGLADLRITQCFATQRITDENERHQYQQRLLTRAKTTLQRSIALDGIEIENLIDGKHLLALVHFLLGDLDRAQEIAQQTLKDAQGHETTRIIERAYRLLGRIYMAQEHPQQASYYFQEAIQICQQHGLKLDYARTLHYYGALLLQQNTHGQNNRTGYTTNYQQGLRYLHDARLIFKECHATIDLATTEQLLASYSNSYTAQVIS